MVTISRVSEEQESLLTAMQERIRRENTERPRHHQTHTLHETIPISRLDTNTTKVRLDAVVTDSHD